MDEKDDNKGVNFFFGMVKLGLILYFLYNFVFFLLYC